jgi:ribosomal-protein-alanine N-acetyltransferase
MRKLWTDRDPEFSIRRMVPEDLDRVLELQKQAFAHPWSADLFKRELTHDWSTILLAEDLVQGEQGRESPRLLGFLIFWLVHDELHVLNLATDPIHRRRGVARALMTRTLATGREHKCVLATLEVRRSNEPAISLYRSFDFRAVGIRPNYYAEEREDAIVMNADL